MASIGEVQSGIQRAIEQAQESLGGLEQARGSLEQAQNELQRVGEGSNQADFSQASALLARAVESIGDVQGQVQSAIKESESIAGRL